MAYYVCSGAKMKCSMGSHGANLCVMHPVEPVRVEGNPIAAMLDYKPMLNIKPFGQCRSLANPVVAAATAANYGRLQPMPCVPNTTLPWIGAKMNVRIKGNPALLDTSKLMCMWAGIIEITNPGQKTMKEGCTPLNYYEGLIQSEEKAKDIKVAVGNAAESGKKVKALTVKDFAEILERIERKKNSYEAARYYAMYHVDYWRLTKLAKRYVDETDDAKKEDEKDNDPNLMPSRYMLLYGADDDKLRGLGNIDEHYDNFDGRQEHEICVANLRKALILLGHDISESGPFDEQLLWAFLLYLRRFGRADWNFVHEDNADAEKPLDDVADKYGLATWKCFYGDECGDGEGGVEHKKVMKKINSTYGDELLKEKGGIPHDYRSSLCYHYPWVPFSLTINRGEEEKTDKKDEDKKVRYKIYDGERDALIAEGTVVDDKIEDLFPDVEYPVVFVDDVRVWLTSQHLSTTLMSNESNEEEDSEPKIVDMYWSYGKGHIKIEEDFQSRYYDDLNLHVETNNYHDGDKIDVFLKNNSDFSLFGNRSELKLSGIVFDNTVVFENIFNVYTMTPNI